MLLIDRAAPAGEQSLLYKAGDVDIGHTEMRKRQSISSFNIWLFLYLAEVMVE